VSYFLKTGSGERDSPKKKLLKKETAPTLITQIITDYTDFLRNNVDLKNLLKIGEGRKRFAESV